MQSVKPIRDRPFQTLDELDAYVDGPRIQCLECGRWFRGLATHLSRIHGITHDDYRKKWHIPKRYALSGTATREALSLQMQDLITSGRLTYDHLPSAVESARMSGRRRKSPVDNARHRRLISEQRPGDHHKFPPGAKRSDGRDADRKREYQIAYRALNQGDPAPMQHYRTKYQKN